MTRFTRAIVRPPGATYADGITRADLGPPDLPLALDQHRGYCAALETAGLSLTHLPPEDAYPDSTFVEDTAVLVPGLAVISHPGAPSRQGEIHSVRAALTCFYPRLAAIEPPGTLDGGDICEAGDHVFIGITARTNPEGAAQLAALLEGEGFTTSTVDVRGSSALLHLKTGMSWLGDRTLVLVDELADRPEFAGYTVIRVPAAESYAANCIRVNDAVILPAGYPVLERQIAALGLRVLPVPMSEYQKMDGGVSCLSLRF
jgi:dimethylargininase